MGLGKSLFHDDLYDGTAGQGIVELHPVQDRMLLELILGHAERLERLPKAPQSRSFPDRQPSGFDVDFIRVR